MRPIETRRSWGGGIETAFSEKRFEWGHFPPQKTTVSPNLSQISAGLNFTPADNSTGDLFGGGFFAPPHGWKRCEKGEKARRGRRRSRSSARSYSVFRFSKIRRLQPWNIPTLFSNETAASLNISPKRLKSAFQETDRMPTHSKITYPKKGAAHS